MTISTEFRKSLLYMFNGKVGVGCYTNRPELSHEVNS